MPKIANELDISKQTTFVLSLRNLNLFTDFGFDLFWKRNS